MLNLWKKIQEKGHINTSPIRKQSPVTTLDPRYDGPLKGFEYNASDFSPLEQCRLKLTFDSIYDNKMGHNYFKNFLDTKMAMEILNLWSMITQNNQQQNQPENRGNYDLCKIKRTSLNSTSLECGESLSNSFSLNEKLAKLPDDLRFKISSLISKSSSIEFVETDINILKPILKELLLEYWNEFIRSEWYCRYQVELLTSRSITLGDILFHDTARTYFTQFLEIEACQNTVEFWFASSYFELFVRNSLNYNQFHDDRNQALNEAINIYEKYLSLQATCPLGFGDEIRCAVEEAICDETNGPRSDCFKPAVDVVLLFLRKTYLLPFFSSQHYVHLLSDMIRNSTSISNHSPTSSVSEYSIESKQPLINKLDPDSIWRRRKQSGLSFGRIDQFGRFQRDIEPDPGRNSESKISRMMKKWVQRNENKVEEEMAWQVAEMVVKDIIDLTMGCSNENDGAEDDCFPSESSKS